MSKTDNNNIYDINDLHNEEELTDEMIQAYLDNADIGTPDLWGRIEVGFDAEIENSVDLEESSKKNHNDGGRRGLRRYAGIAAAIVVCAIVIPVAMLSNNNKNVKNEEIDSKDYYDNAADDSDITEVQESAEMADESMDMMPESADMTDDIAGDIQQAASSEGSTVLVTLEYVTADNGTDNVYATVQKVISDSGDVRLLADGDVITFINQDQFEEMYKAYNKRADGEYEIVVTDVTESEDGSYMARFMEFR